MASPVFISFVSRLVWVLIALAPAGGLDFNPVSKTECRSVMTSVRMEVSPLMVHAICRDDSSAALSTTCGEAVWTDAIQGFCNSFDLNIGQVLMNRTLPSTTITLHLVKLGQILDAARVVILTSQEVRHYRISVWGHQNTRFVLTIASKCPPDTVGQDPKQFRGGPSAVDALTPFSTTSSLWTPSSTVPTGAAPADVMSGLENNTALPEYARPNKLPKSQLDELLASPATVFGQKSGMSRGRKKVNVHRSKAPVSPSDAERERIFLDASREDTLEGGPENSELAKLQWMEDKRVLFEKKLELLQKQLQSNASGEDYKDYKDYTTESGENLSGEFKQTSRGDRGKSIDAFHSVKPVFRDNGTDFIEKYKENLINTSIIDKDSRVIDTTTLKSSDIPEIQVLSNKKHEGLQTLKPVRLSFRTLNNEDLPLFLSERDSSVPEAAIEMLENPTASSVSNESLAQTRPLASSPDGGLPLFLNFPLELLSESIESSSVLDLPKPSALDEHLNSPSASFLVSSFTVSPTMDAIPSTVTQVPVIPLETYSGTHQTTNVLTSLEIETSTLTTMTSQLTEPPGTKGSLTEGEITPSSSWQQTVHTDGVNLVTSSHSTEHDSKQTLLPTTTNQLLLSSTAGLTSEILPNTKREESSQPPSNKISASLSSTRSPVTGTDFGTSSSHTDTLTLQTSAAATLGSVATSHSSEVNVVVGTSSLHSSTMTPEPSITTTTASMVTYHSPGTVQMQSSIAETQPSASATTSLTSSTFVTEVTTAAPTPAPSSSKLNKPTLPNFSLGIPVLPTGDDSATTANATLHPEGNEGDGISDAQFWPLVASLVIGIPAVVVIGIGVTVIHRRRKPDPQKMYHMKALRATGTPKMSAGSDTLRSTMMHQTSVDV